MSPIFEEFTMFKPQAGKARANATFNQWKYHNMIIHTWRTIDNRFAQWSTIQQSLLWTNSFVFISIRTEVILRYGSPRQGFMLGIYRNFVFWFVYSKPKYKTYNMLCTKWGDQSDYYDEIIWMVYFHCNVWSEVEWIVFGNVSAVTFWFRQLWVRSFLRTTSATLCDCNICSWWVLSQDF